MVARTPTATTSLTYETTVRTKLHPINPTAVLQLLHPAGATAVKNRRQRNQQKNHNQRIRHQLTTHNKVEKNQYRW